MPEHVLMPQKLALNEHIKSYWKEGRKFHLMMLSTHFIYGYMVSDHSDSESGKLLPPLHGLLFPISSKGSFICTIPQTG